MRISDWSSDVCSSDLLRSVIGIRGVKRVSMHEPLTSLYAVIAIQFERGVPATEAWRALYAASTLHRFAGKWIIAIDEDIDPTNADALFWAMSYRCQPQHRSEEHTSELQSLMRNSYAVFCLKKKKKTNNTTDKN